MLFDPAYATSVPRRFSDLNWTTEPELRSASCLPRAQPLSNVLFGGHVHVEPQLFVEIPILTVTEE
ncbi:MAG: hypothetical protein WEG36_10455 [Gemmatimonadota bacterium]